MTRAADFPLPTVKIACRKCGRIQAQLLRRLGWPQYDAAGREIADREPRVSGMSWKGAPLDPDKEFLVATTDHRAGGGGLYRAFEHEEVVVQGQNPVRKALQEYLETGAHHEMPSKGPWRFAPDLGQSAILHTAPEAVNHLSEIAALRPEVKGIDEDGFLQLKLHL